MQERSNNRNVIFSLTLRNPLSKSVEKNKGKNAENKSDAKQNLTKTSFTYIHVLTFVLYILFIELCMPNVAGRNCPSFRYKAYHKWVDTCDYTVNM